MPAPREDESQTSRLGKSVLEIAKSIGAEIELIDIANLKSSFVMLARSAIELENACMINDFRTLYDKILFADGIVLSSPNISGAYGSIN